MSYSMDVLISILLKFFNNLIKTITNATAATTKKNVNLEIWLNLCNNIALPLCFSSLVCNAVDKFTSSYSIKI